jgi:hypothetical protein
MAPLRSFVFVFSFFFILGTLKGQKNDIIAPSSNLVIQGIPDIPQSIARDAERKDPARKVLPIVKLTDEMVNGRNF